MTWGDIDGTPVLLDMSTPGLRGGGLGGSSTGHTFSLPKTSAREKVAQKLTEVSLGRVVRELVRKLCSPPQDSTRRRRSKMRASANHLKQRNKRFTPMRYGSATPGKRGAVYDASPSASMLSPAARSLLRKHNRRSSRMASELRASYASPSPRVSSGGKGRRTAQRSVSARARSVSKTPRRPSGDGPRGSGKDKNSLTDNLLQL